MTSVRFTDSETKELLKYEESKNPVYQIGHSVMLRLKDGHEEKYKVLEVIHDSGRVEVIVSLP